MNSEVKSVDSEAKKCGFVKKNSHFFYCLLPKVWFKGDQMANLVTKITNNFSHFMELEGNFLTDVFHIHWLMIWYK